MLAVFCLRLATGMLACLLILPARLVNPRYFRTHFLVAMGLVGLAWFFLPYFVPIVGILLIVGLVLLFAGSFVWALEGAPGGKGLVLLSCLTLAAALGGVEFVRLVEAHVASRDPTGSVLTIPFQAAVEAVLPQLPLVLAGSYTSAALLGAALSAMLMGHIYLMAPSMSLAPLLRLLAVLGITLAARLLVDGYAFWCWTARPHRGMLGDDALLLLPVRWGVGFVLPLVLGWMAWQTTRIRSTQSATGILYVVVIFCFLGELTSLLLRDGGLSL